MSCCGAVVWHRRRRVDARRSAATTTKALGFVLLRCAIDDFWAEAAGAGVDVGGAGGGDDDGRDGDGDGDEKKKDEAGHRRRRLRRRVTPMTVRSFSHAPRTLFKGLFDARAMRTGSLRS